MMYSQLNKTFRAAPAVMLCAVVATSAVALADDDDHEGEHFDIGVWNDNGTLRTGGWDHDTESLEVDYLRVFEAEFGEDPAFPWSIDEPGVGGEDLGLPVGGTLTMRLASGLGVWNGSGFDTTSDTTMFVDYGPSSVDSLTGGDTNFILTEEFDEHPIFSIEENTADGAYLLEFNFLMDGFASSDPIWIVFNLGLDHEDYEASVEWVESNLVPAPAVLPALGMAALFGRRRRS